MEWTELLILSGLFLLLSGVAALSYQVVWVRLLGLSMGSTAASVATVLAAFFAGLAAGSALADRLTRRRPGIGAYLLLETGIAIGGLALLPLLLRLDALVTTLPAAIASSLATKFGLTVLLLSLPTMCMGATFPVMADLLSRGRSDLGRRLSLVYSLNTWGAVAGAALAGFVLVPKLGLDGAVLFAVCCNLTIVLVGLAARPVFAAALSESTATATASSAETAAVPSRAATAHSRIALLALAATGFGSIAAEVGWTKYLAVFTGATLYGFSTILAVFLAGIALGSWLVRPLLGRPERTVHVLTVGLILLGVSIACTRPALSLAPAVLTLLDRHDAAAALAYLFVVAVLAPPTLLLGALFPASLELYCSGYPNLRARAGRAYAINTLAGIAGSVFAGFLVIPYLGTDALLKTTALLFPLVALVTARSMTTQVSRWLASGAAVATVVITLTLPALDYRPLVRAVTMRDPSAAVDDPLIWRFEYLQESHAGVISVITRDGVSGALQTNGLTESHLNFFDPTAGSPTESLLGLVPYLLHPDPRNAFVVGFGGGNTAFALTRTRDLESIRVIELEPAIVEAVRTATRDFVPALLDPRVELIFNDARNALLVEPSLYEIIVSQPSHPWLAGCGTLFTREFFQIVRARLRPGGVFGQWVNLFHMDAVTLAAILKSFHEVFPYGFSLRPAGGNDLLVFGSEWPLLLDPARVDEKLRHRELAAHLGRLHVRSVADLSRDFALSRAEALAAAGHGPANTDRNLLSEVRLARLGKAGIRGPDAKSFLATVRGFDLLPYLPAEDAAAVLRSLAEDLASRGHAEEAAVVRRRLAEAVARERETR